MPTRLPQTLITIVATTSVIALAGCTGSSAPTTSTPSTAPAPTSASPSPASPAQQLQHLAALGAMAAFHATYAVRQSHPSSRATWQVWRTRSSLRVDVVTKRRTATVISTAHATFSCSRGNHHRACFRVAKAGAAIPVALRLLAVRLFTSDVTGIAAHPERYGIAAATPGSVPGSTHGGTCFHLTVPKETAGVETGSYCFNPAGVLTVVAYPNGNIVRLTHLAAQAPQKSVFVPYSSPTPLPK